MLRNKSVKEVSLPQGKNDVPEQKHHYVLIILGIILVLATIAFIIAINFDEDVEVLGVCGDGTFYEACSLTEPYYCDSVTGKLVEKASICGCGDLDKLGETCFSTYEIDSKEISLKYVLNGDEKTLDFTVYGGVDSYVSDLPREIFYLGDEIPERSDFKLKSINEETQRIFLLPLVAAIQNISNDRDEQVRIAISLVQNIPYGFSDKKLIVSGNEINYTRYPYEVLYDGEGICGEKSSLLVFLLKEMGYGTSLFYYSDENHESIGIKCPVEESLHGSGYCFIETTGPSIITDNSIEYVGGVTLDSYPEISILSQGDSIGKDWSEYGDADTMGKIRQGKFVLFRGSKLEKLRKKYGLVEEYNVV